jgi:hypothetical protein
MYWECGQCCVVHMWVLASNIAVGVYVLDMWSVLCVPCGWWDIIYRYYCTYWTSGQCCVFRKLVLRSNIAIGLYVLDMWSVLCVPYVGVGV